MTTLLIDGDVLLYKATIVSEAEFDWGDDIVTIHSDLGEVRQIITGMVNALVEAYDAEDVKIAMSSKVNFRTSVDETYKSNRDSRKPVGFAIARDWMKMEFKVTEIEGLEADDVLGVWATQKSLRGKTVICTVDKDLKQIPGKYHNMNTQELLEISEADGYRFHMYQTLCGDPVDGYPGCPGIGDKRATKILDEAEGDLWSAVVAAYAKAGLTEEDALRQARLAKILQVTDINRETKAPILWTPKNHSSGPTGTTANGAASTSNAPVAKRKKQRTAQS
jgi:DNA polymerase-1